MRRLVEYLRTLEPIDPNDPDFPVVIDAMAAAAGRASTGGRQAYWVVDPSGETVADMVSMVDLAGLGRLAIADPDGWEARAVGLAIHSAGERDSVRWTLESLVSLARASRPRHAPIP